MKKQFAKRILAAILTICMLAVMLPSALAAGVTKSAYTRLQTANKANNFDYEYGHKWIQAEAAGGVVTAVFDVPSDGKSDLPYYAALVPTNSSGAPTGDVRYARLVESGGKLSLSYRRDGCRFYTAMVVQPLPDGGTASVTAKVGGAEQLKHKAGLAQTYQVNFTASLQISQTLARLVDANQDDERMNDLKFVAHVRFSKGLTVDRDSLTLTSSIFTYDSSKIVTDPAGEKGFDVTCTLREDWLETDGTQTLAQKLENDTLSFTGNAAITGGEVETLIANGQGAIYTMGWTTIENIPTAGGLDGTLVVAAPLNTLPLLITDDLAVTVTDENGAPLSGAVVKLTPVANSAETPRNATTDEFGHAAFPGIEYSIYRADVTYTKDGTPYTETQTVSFAAGAAPVTIQVPLNQNKTLTTKVTTSNEGEKSQSASVDNLYNAATVSAGAEHAEIVLHVEKEKAEETAPAKIIAKVEAVTGDDIAPGKLALTDFVDITVTKTETIETTDGTVEKEEPVKETDQLLTIYIPVPDALLALIKENGASMQDILAYRHHKKADGDENVTPLAKVNKGANREGYYIESFSGDGDAKHYVVLCARQFSVYAFGIQLVEDTIIDEPTGGTQGGGQSTDHGISVADSSHGSVKSSHAKASAGTTVTLTVEPESGYRLGTLTVKDSGGKSIDVKAGSDGTYTFAMPKGKVAITATFLLNLADPAATGVSTWLNTRDHMAFMVGFETGNFGPDGSVTRAQVAQIFYRLLNDPNVEITKHFDDVPADIWYEDAVNTLASLGIIVGVGNGKFDPERPITRAEFAAIAVRFAKESTEHTLTFPDVSEDNWAYRYIMTATFYGWVNGYDSGLFAPEDDITRAQAAAIVNRILGRLADKEAIDRGECKTFPDVSKDHWGWYDICEAVTQHEYHMNSDRTVETWIK